jgi:hypothetical protein
MYKGWAFLVLAPRPQGIIELTSTSSVILQKEMEKQDMQLIIEILAKAEANRKTEKKRNGGQEEDRQ